LNEGEFFFDKGQLVDARMGKLTGFQAINAVSFLRDVNFKFDPSAAAPAHSSITANERLLLKDFFGIGTIRTLENGQQPHDAEALFWPDDHVPPQQVVPLAEVQELEHKAPEAQAKTDSTPRIVNNESLWADPAATPPAPITKDNEPLHKSEERQVAQPPLPAPPISNVSDRGRETTVVAGSARREPRPIVSRRNYRPAVAVLVLLIGAALAVALAYRLSQGNNSPSVASTVQTSAPVQTPAPIQASSPAGVAPVTKEEVAQSDHRNPAAPDLSGHWTVINTIQKTSFQSFKNMEVGFNVAINQNGNEFTGRGEKISENGRSLAGASRTPIVVKGSIEGNRVEASFSEQGEARKSSGRFLWRIDKGGGLTGRFVSTAARASGKSAAKKQS